MQIIDSGICNLVNIKIAEFDPVSCIRGARSFTRNYKIVDFPASEMLILVRFVFNPIHENKVVRFL